MFITKKYISRRQMLRGMGGVIALPVLDAMWPAMTPTRVIAAANPKARLACLEMVHGAAGCAPEGLEKHMWSPEAVGANFDLSQTSLVSLEPYRKYLTIISNTDCKNAEAVVANEIGGDHFRSAAVFLTQAHPKQTMGSDVTAGPSIDQLYAKKFGQDTPVPSLQLSIESLDQSGGCYYGYSCAYTDTISWASPSEPLPAVRDPRVVFDQLFGVGRTAEDRAAHRRTSRSILDLVTQQVSRIKDNLGAGDRHRLDAYLTDVREIERRIQKIEEHNASSVEVGSVPNAPIGVPESFEEHVRLMFDLQVIAFQSGITRVSAFKLGRDNSSRVYKESGVPEPFHRTSHHGGAGEGLAKFQKINKYHVSMVPYFLEKLKNTPDGESNLLENTLVLYGSPMGDSNIHNHKRCPLFLAGHAGGTLKGNEHLMAPDGTPMANVFLTLMHRLGVDDVTRIGDSTGEFSI